MKYLFPTLLFVLLTTLSHSQTQIGNDIDGEAVNDNSGESVSMPDANTLAIGAIYNDDNGVNSGHVRVYTWNGNNWNQKGNDIDGEANYDRSGKSVSMPDSNTLAIGAHWNNGTAPTSGHVRVYTWNGNSWNQKGNDIDGEAFFDRSGISVSMPDKNTVAIGATTNDGNGTDAGHVRIYIWNGTNWIQKGNDIDGEAADDLSGNSVSMPDSNTVAIGAYNNDGNGAHSGHVRIYSWNGTAWVQKGIDIDGEAADDESGHAVSMPDSNTVAIGAPKNDGTATNAGHVRIYSWNGNSWIQKGNDIDGEAFYDHSGWSVSMSDSNTLVIGAKFNSGNGSLSGHVRVYYWNANSWVQVGNDIDGETAHDRSGYSVSMPDNNTVSIGARLNNGNGAYAGHVRVYSLQSTYNTISPVVCNSFTSPSGNYTWTTSGTYYDTLLNAAGLDSIITVNLTINQNSFASISPIVCSSFTSPSGNYTWSASGTHMDTIPNATGCDSIITINLTVNQNSFASISPVVCDSYISPSGNYTWYSSGTYMDTIFNSTGCDSIITINLTVNNSSSASISPVVCDSYTSPSGNYTWTTSGTYIDTLPNSVGCDSIITVNLTVQSNGSTQNIVVCDTNSYTWPVNLQTYPLSGTYTTTLSNVAGCDSIITLNLDINNSTTANISPVVCNNYNSPSGNHTWTTSGTYMDTISNTVGCDSIITINLTVNNSNAGSQSEIACDSYTWPANNQTYTSSGNYTTTLTNSAGCDSLVTLNLTVNNSTSASISPVVCNSYTSPSGNYTWTSSGTYQDTISNSVGCDSVITVNLTVNSNTSSQNKITCNSYTWPANNQTYTSSGNYSTTLTNSNGCDSVVTLNLTVNDSTFESISPVVCDSYTSPNGNYTWTTSGTYMDTISNTAGCDSIITINLTVNNSNAGSQSEIACDSYTWPANNQTYTSSGNYTTTLTNSAGCDSLVTLNLTVNNITSASISPVVCNSYTSPSGNYTWTSSGTYQDTISNSVGCDSVITVNLTINSNTGSQSEIVCDSYTWPANNQTYTSSGNYTTTLTNSAGCDSVVTLNLTVNNSTSASISPFVCNSYTSPSGNYTWTSSGTYQDTISNSVGCDSIISINLTVNNSNAGSQSELACDSYTWAANNQTYTSSGNYTTTLTNSAGCDSVVTLNLTVNDSSSSTISPVVCDNYTSPSGNYNWTSSGTYMDTIQNAEGCDSIITVNLTVNQSTTSSISPVVCDSYTSPSGNYNWTTSGTYMDTISNSSGCDSVITIDLNVDSINTAVQNSGDSLIAQDTGATYQWVNCDNNSTPIPGETGQILEVAASGDYAVSLTKHGCVDTSACYNVIPSGFETAIFEENKIVVYPNPNDGLFTIEHSFTESKPFEVTNINGKVLYRGTLTQKQTKVDLSNFATGIYLLRVKGAVVKLVLK